MTYVFTFLMVVVGCSVAITLYNWVKAERDERLWRRMLEDEQHEEGVFYRLVRDERSDRE